MNLKNLIKITKNQLFTGLILSISLLTGLLFEPSIKALESGATESKPIGRYVPPHQRKTLVLGDASEKSAFTAFEPLAVTPVSASATGIAASPLEPRSTRGSFHDNIDGFSATPKAPSRTIAGAFKRHKMVSWASPEVNRTSNRFSPKPLSTYADFLAGLAKRRAEHAAREARIADARRIHDACDIADLGRSVRKAYVPKCERFEIEYQEYLRNQALTTAYQSPKLKEKLKIVVTAKEV